MRTKLENHPDHRGLQLTFSARFAYLILCYMLNTGTVKLNGFFWSILCVMFSIVFGHKYFFGARSALELR